MDRPTPLRVRLNYDHNIFGVIIRIGKDRQTAKVRMTSPKIFGQVWPIKVKDLDVYNQHAGGWMSLEYAFGVMDEWQRRQSEGNTSKK